MGLKNKQIVYKTGSLSGITIPDIEENPPELFTYIKVKQKKSGQVFYLDRDRKLVNASQADTFSFEEANQIILEMKKSLPDYEISPFRTTKKMKECPRCGANLPDGANLCAACRQQALLVQSFVPPLPKKIDEEFRFKSSRTYYHGKYGFTAFNSMGEQVGIISDFADDYSELHFFPKYHSQYGERIPLVYIGGGGVQWKPLCQALKTQEACEKWVETQYISYNMGAIMGLINDNPSNPPIFAELAEVLDKPEKFTCIQVKVGEQGFYLDRYYNLVDAFRAHVFSLEKVQEIISEVGKALKDCDVTAVCTMKKLTHSSDIEPKPSFSKKNCDSLPKPPICSGMKVLHKKYGEGTIVKSDDKGWGRKYLTIEFASGVKTFSYPMCFEKGYLEIKS